MTPQMMSGFTSELEKVAKYKALTTVMKNFKQTGVGKSATGRSIRGTVARFQRSPEFRRAIGSGARLGGAAGGTANVLADGSDRSTIEKFLRGAAGGAAAGALTGAARPGLFRRSSVRAEGERITKLKSKRGKRGKRRAK